MPILRTTPRKRVRERRPFERILAPIPEEAYVDVRGAGMEIGGSSQPPDWSGMSETELTRLVQAGVRVPDAAIAELRRRVHARARESQEYRERTMEAYERSRRDSRAVVPYTGGPLIGADEAGPPRVRPEVPERDMPVRKRHRLSVIVEEEEEQVEWRDIHVIPTPVPPIPVPSPVPSPLPSPDPFEDPAEQFTPPGRFILSEDEEEADPFEDTDTEPVPLSPPVVAPSPAAAHSPGATPPPVVPIPAGDMLPVTLVAEYMTTRGQLEESRRMIDTLLQRIAGGRGGVIPDGVSLGLISIELRALGDLRRLLAERGDLAWRAQIEDVVTSMMVRIRDVVRAGLP